MFDLKIPKGSDQQFSLPWLFTLRYAAFLLLLNQAIGLSISKEEGGVVFLERTWEGEWEGQISLCLFTPKYVFQLYLQRNYSCMCVCPKCPLQPPVPGEHLSSAGLHKQQYLEAQNPLSNFCVCPYVLPAFMPGSPGLPLLHITAGYKMKLSINFQDKLISTRHFMNLIHSTEDLKITR